MTQRKRKINRKIHRKTKRHHKRHTRKKLKGGGLSKGKIAAAVLAGVAAAAAGGYGAYKYKKRRDLANFKAAKKKHKENFFKANPHYEEKDGVIVNRIKGGNVGDKFIRGLAGTSQVLTNLFNVF